MNPADCIGHGACRDGLPDRRDHAGARQRARAASTFRVLGPDFQTNVPGIFVAGELGGMGLIRNAIEQGRQAIDAVRQLPGIGRGDGASTS